MMPTRRRFLLGGAALALPPSLYLAARNRQGRDDEQRRLEASLARRYTNLLRLPGRHGWMTPLKATTISRIEAVPVNGKLRGNKSTGLWVYRAHAGDVSVINPILTGRPGDTVGLAFENHIPQPSIIHWHGFANDTNNDGSGAVAAAPGGRQNYQWKIQNNAGLNWYHPHPHRNAGEQVWRGMSGLFIVEDDASDRLARTLDVKMGETDIPLVIQDRTLDRSGAMIYPEGAAARFHGSVGNDILVNMTRFPAIALPRRWVRFRILNGSNARLYKIGFRQETAALAFALLGTDGALLNAPQIVREIFLAPAQRIDIAIDLRQARAGDVWLKTLPFDPMHHESKTGDKGQDNPGPQENTGQDHMAHHGAASAAASRSAASVADTADAHVHGMQGEGAEAPILRIEVKSHEGAAGTLPAHIAGIPAMPVCVKPRTLLLDHDGRGQWRINGKSFHQAHRAFSIERGTRETWNIRNTDASMPHPMHLHGFSFDVVARGGSPAQVRALAVDATGRSAQDLGRQDTVLVWPGETVSITIDFSMPFPGTQHFMFHCHNLEHEDMGMMLGFSVGR